jgi:hypothetical protein
VNFWFYGGVALVFVLSGAALALPGHALALALGVLSAAVGSLARRTRRLTLAGHAAAYGIAAVAASGLLSAAAGATFSRSASWPAIHPAALVVLALAFCAAWLTAGGDGRAVERLPRLGLVAAVAIAGEAVALTALAPRIAGADAGAIATVRTAVLVLATFLLAYVGRSDAWREARWLVYPLLAATGLKLLLEDVSRSRPATLFVAFAAYGAALILVPRLRRREPPAAAAAH